MKIRMISDGQIRELNILQQDIFDLVLSGFQQHGTGDYENPPKKAIHTQPRAFMHAMPGYLPKSGLAGTKLISVYPDNPSKGIPSLYQRDHRDVGPGNRIVPVCTGCNLDHQGENSGGKHGHNEILVPKEEPNLWDRWSYRGLRKSALGCHP